MAALADATFDCDAVERQVYAATNLLAGRDKGPRHGRGGAGEQMRGGEEVGNTPSSIIFPRALLALLTADVKAFLTSLAHCLSDRSIYG